MLVQFMHSTPRLRKCPVEKQYQLSTTAGLGKIFASDESMISQRCSMGRDLI